MNNRFGLKDFVILGLLAVVGLSLWLFMFAQDRKWGRLQASDASIGELKQQISSASDETRKQISSLKEQVESLQKQVASVHNDAVAVARAARAAGGDARSTGGGGGLHDESWARPGVKVEWQEPWTFKIDPRTQPGYQSGGEFTEIFEAQPPTITPLIAKDIYGQRIYSLVVESLGAYDPQTLRLRGLLAEAWQIDPSGLWLRAKIRDEAKFSDGSDVTAEDFRWTFADFIMNKDIDLESVRSIVADSIKDVKVISPKVVEFEFFQPLFLNVDNALGTVFALPKKFYSQFTPAQLNQSTGLLMGSGPFKLENLDKDNQWRVSDPVVLVRNENYWCDKPPLEKIRFKAIDSELARLTEYTNGDAQMITPSAAQFVAKDRDPDAQARDAWRAANQDLNWVNMQSGRSGIAWNCDKRKGKFTPMHDKRVRRAMTMLLDRQAMINDIWKGVGTVAKGFFNPGTPGDDPSVPPLPYDPAGAMKLLEEAGWKLDAQKVLRDRDGNPFIFELTSFGSSELSVRICKYLQDAYAVAGIEMRVRTMDWSVGDDVRHQRDFDGMLMGWGASAPESDPKQIFHSDAIKNQGDNFCQWSSPAADEAIDKARKEMDPVKRAELWRAFAKVMADEQPYSWIRVQPWVRFVKADVGNVQTYPAALQEWEFFRKGPVGATTVK